MNPNPERIFGDYQAAASGQKAGLVAATGGARFASYSGEEIAALPADAVEASFGCGNPLAFSLVRRGQTVLDLGCGAGIDLMLAADRVGSNGNVIGVDNTPAMIQRANKNIREAGYGNIEIRQGLIEELPIGDNSVDWVMSNCVINLSNNKNKVFSEIFRVLKPNGRMMVSDIVADKLPFWMRRSAMLTSACVAGAISESEYLSGLSGAGLDRCEIVSRNYYEPSQLAAVVKDSLPKYLADTFVGCCVSAAAKHLAKSINTKFWSARIHARKPQVIA